MRSLVGSVIQSSLKRGVKVVSMLVMATAFLASCDIDAPKKSNKVKLVSATDRVTGEQFITTQEDQPIKFFSRENLRETVFSGNIDAKLKKPQGGNPGGFLNTNDVNGPASGGAASEFQVEITTNEVLIEPLRHQQVIGGQWQPKFGSGGAVSLNYENTPLEEVIQNILGGILGVNYITSDNLVGEVTFRTERRFDKGELVQILADILARNGYLIQYFNSVYHIGLPEELDTLTGLRGRTGLESDQTFVVELNDTAPENIAEIAAALIPPGNTISAVPETNNVVVRGDPTQFRSIEGLLKSLAGKGPQRNILAILPLRRSSPEAVASQLSAVYTERDLGDVIFLPLEQRQGILVVAESQKLVNDARKLARGLDVDYRDSAKLRIIQLTYLDASQTASQLNEVFANTASSQPVNDEPEGFDSDVIKSAIDRASSGESSRGVSDSSGDSIPTPKFFRTNNDTRQNGNSGQGQAGTAVQNDAPVETATGVSIAADARNNALLVRSSYGEYKRIAAAVKALDVPLSQVVIEATIVEVTINDTLQYGVQAFLQRFDNTFRTAPTTGAADPGGAGFAAVVQWSSGSSNIQAVLTALQSVSDVKVISSPYLTVANGATSRLSVGDEIPFVTASQTSNSDGTVTVTQEVESRDVGVILEVTPTIAPDNSVVLDIRQEVSSAATVATAAGVNPTISERTIESQITVASGNTILLGGLIQERSDRTEDGVPVLRKIPILGEAFKQTTDTQRRSELLIMITPRVARNNTQINDITNQLKWQLTSRND